jgi:hypothetical protein
MQAARNCLEHRAGIVSKADAGPGGVMELRFPRLKFFVVREGSELDVHEGMEVAAGTEIFTRLEVRIRKFNVGERLTITAADFDEIAFASFHFASQLAQLLPKIQPVAD